MNKILLVVSVAFAGSIFHANGASFDCKKAKSFSEKQFAQILNFQKMMMT